MLKICYDIGKFINEIETQINKHYRRDVLSRLVTAERGKSTYGLKPSNNAERIIIICIMLHHYLQHYNLNMEYVIIEDSATQLEQ